LRHEILSREIGRRVQWDVDAARADGHALLQAEIASRTPEARIHFPALRA
jgi:hypothetical protein